MNLLEALRINAGEKIAFVGGGGKSSLIFLLAQIITRINNQSAVITSTTHLACKQTSWSDKHIKIRNIAEIKGIQFGSSGQMLMITGDFLNGGDNKTGSKDPCRTAGLKPNELDYLNEIIQNKNVNLLIEADGSRQHPLKAPAEHEPVIPNWVDKVVVVAGMQGLGKPLNGDHIHRPEIFSKISGVPIGQPVSVDALIKVLSSTEGGLKNIPQNAHKVLLLNQIHSNEDMENAEKVAKHLLDDFDIITVSRLFGENTKNKEPFPKPVLENAVVLRVIQKTAGIILAAGSSSRFGEPKLTMPWKGKAIIAHVIETALRSKLSQLRIVVGNRSKELDNIITKYPLEVIRNPDWKLGQGSSVSAGIKNITKEIGSAIFLLGDQPLIDSSIIEALIDRHQLTLSPIIIPTINGRNANPVLFDKNTFRDLSRLKGQDGGRALFQNYHVDQMEWKDPRLLFDIDTQQDYQQLLTYL